MSCRGLPAPAKAGVPGIQTSASTRACRTMGPGDKHRDDQGTRMSVTDHQTGQILRVRASPSPAHPLWKSKPRRLETRAALGSLPPAAPATRAPAWSERACRGRARWGVPRGQEHPDLLRRHRPGRRLHARRGAHQRLQALPRRPRLARQPHRPQAAAGLLRRRARLPCPRRGHQDHAVSPHLQPSEQGDRPRHHPEHHRLLRRDHSRLAARRPHLPVRLQPRRLHRALRGRRPQVLRRADGGQGRRARAAAAARSQIRATHRHRSRQARLPARRLDQGRSPLASSARSARSGSGTSTSPATPRSPTPRPISSACGIRSRRWAPARAGSCCWPLSIRGCARASRWLARC